MKRTAAFRLGKEVKDALEKVNNEGLRSDLTVQEKRGMGKAKWYKERIYIQADKRKGHVSIVED